MTSYVEIFALEENRRNLILSLFLMKTSVLLEFWPITWHPECETGKQRVLDREYMLLFQAWSTKQVICSGIPDRGRVFWSLPLQSSP